MDLDLVQIAIFLISEKIANGSEVYSLRMNKDKERSVLKLDEMICKIKHHDIAVADLTPTLNPHKMVEQLKDFTPTEFGFQFEHLDDLFQRELLNKTKIAISSVLFLALIEYFNNSKNYAKRVTYSFPEVFNKKFNGLLEKYNVCNAKTGFWIAVLEFFKSNTTPTVLDEYKELSFGSLLYLLFIKANLMCTIDKVFTVGGELVANITNSRIQSATLMRSSTCKEDDCNLTFQVAIHNQLVIIIKCWYIYECRLHR